MHDLSFFLLKNWLPVGVAAIVFFGIGLLLAKFTWGRFSQRLTFAIEENINLAGQWSALGASQRDLFKKLRVRWQADRDIWESAILEKDNRISELTRQFAASGRELPGESAEEPTAVAKVRELEGALQSERAETLRLRNEIREVQFKSVASASVGADDVAVTDLQSRIRDLEQDLIDTHDELHEVRQGYEKQLSLVESLEARLIADPVSKGDDELTFSVGKIVELERKLAEAEKFSREQVGELSQLRALLPQRNREMKHFRTSFTAIKSSLMARMEAEKISSSADFQAQLETIETARTEAEYLFDTRLNALSDELSLRKKEMAALEVDLLAKTGDLAAAREKIAELEVIQRRKISLQAELNDACHELYDVRRALNQRIAEIGVLEARLAGLDDTEARNGELVQQLAETREELAATIHALSESRERLNDGIEELADVRQAYNEKLLESESLSLQLGDARHELSDVRLAYNAKVSEFQTAKAQMEELEAIIEDRSAEVNDLSTELRTQRDQVRQLKNTLAETEGELEALVDESKILNAGVNAKIAYGEEQRLRIAALELALSQRYSELNLVRVEADDYSKQSRHFEAQAKQLGAELDRRSLEFVASDLRVANAEEAVEAANAKIAALSGQLEKSEHAMGQLQEELRQVSREKDETIRELDRATRRIAQLEEAAQIRESQLSVIEHELRESREHAGDLDVRLKRLNTELESAREEQEISRVGIAELEAALRASDERTLQLSGRLEEKEAEASGQREELASLKSSLDAREAGEVEAQVRLATLQSELEGKLSNAIKENEILTTRHQEEADRQMAAIEALKIVISAQAAKLEEETAQRSQGLSVISGLQAKLDKRMEVIRDLQVQISTIMMQRSSRDSEISMLKDKLKAVEEELSNALLKESLLAPKSLSPSFGLVDDESLAAAIEQSLATESPDEDGISLDELAGKTTHHTPQKTAETGLQPGLEAVKKTSNDDGAVYFGESSAALSESEIAKIDDYARAIRRFGRKVEVTVIGYAGAEGTPDFTEALSARRADAVRERLLERGVSQAVVSVRGAGQDRRFTDRRAWRVELIVVPLAVAETVN